MSSQGVRALQGRVVEAGDRFAGGIEDERLDPRVRETVGKAHVRHDEPRARVREEAAKGRRTARLRNRPRSPRAVRNHRRWRLLLPYPAPEKPPIAA